MAVLTVCCIAFLAEAGAVGLSVGWETSTQAVSSVGVNLALDDARYLPLAFALPQAQAARLEVSVPTEWKQEIAAYRQENSSNRCQLVSLSNESIAVKANEPLILWLNVSSRNHPAAEHRIPLQVRMDGTPIASLAIQLHIWPVSVTGAERPFHVRGYWNLPSMTGGYEASEESVRRLDTFLRAYAEMGGDVFDWTVNWPQVLPHVRIANSERTLSATATRNEPPLDFEHLPQLDFSYYYPWFDVARRHGVTRFEAHMENVTSERWQWALDTAFGKGRVKAGTPEASRCSAWLFSELKRHLEQREFHGFFAKISDEISPESIPSYLVTAKVAREAGWRPFTTITGMIPRTAGQIEAMDPLCDQWQLSFSGKDAFLDLRKQRYSLSPTNIMLQTKWHRYSNGGAERTWVATKVFGPNSTTGIPSDEVEELEVLDNGQVLSLSGGSPWGNRKTGIAFTAGVLGSAIYVSPGDGQDPNGRRIKLNIVRRQKDSAGKILVSIDPSDELWFYGGPVRPDRLPYDRTWTFPVMVLYHGFQGYGQWAFYWWQETSRIVWLDAPNRMEISPAYCGFRDGWRDAVLLHQLMKKAGRIAYDKILGADPPALLRVGTTRDPSYPNGSREAPQITAIVNAKDFSAINAARRQALQALAAE